jgi:hypothetical protein
MDTKAMLSKVFGELFKKDRLIAFALGLVVTALAAITNLPEGKVHELVCGKGATEAPAVEQPQ